MWIRTEVLTTTTCNASHDRLTVLRSARLRVGTFRRRVVVLLVIGLLVIGLVVVRRHARVRGVLLLGDGSDPAVVLSDEHLFALCVLPLGLRLVRGFMFAFRVVVSHERESARTC